MTEQGAHSKGIERVADALTGATERREIAALEEKEHAINRAEEVIYAEVSRWVGFAVKLGEPIPIVRNGRKVGQMPVPLFSGNPARRVAEEARTEEIHEIKRRIELFRSISTASRAVLAAIFEANMMDKIELDAAAKMLQWKSRETQHVPLQMRLIREIGSVDAATIAMFDLLEASSSELERLEAELEKRGVGRRGRSRNEAAHAVALELARLYAKVTGKRPTYSVGVDGISGEFTPALRNVFDALGWEKLNMRGPATRARDAISDSDTVYVENSLGSIFSSGSQE